MDAPCGKRKSETRMHHRQRYAEIACAASIDAAQVRAMKAEGKGASEIAKALKIGQASVYRVLEAG